jgi:transcriptional regulator with XRE-family HTH domain
MPLRAATPDIASRLGRRLRGRRTELGRTLAEVAAAAQVSASFLSSLETGGSSVSLPVLVRIAHALDLTMADLLAADGSQPVRRTRLDATAGGRLVSHPALQLRVAFLSAGPNQEGTCPLQDVRGALFVYLRSGSLVVTVDGENWTLGEGDALDADVSGEVHWQTAGSPVVAIWVTQPFASPA